jgi:hypothetical protein
MGKKWSAIQTEIESLSGRVSATSTTQVSDGNHVKGSLEGIKKWN